MSNDYATKIIGRLGDDGPVLATFDLTDRAGAVAWAEGFSRTGFLRCAELLHPKVGRVQSFRDGVASKYNRWAEVS